MLLRVYVDLIYVLFRFVANSCYWEAAAPDSVAYSDQVMDRYHTAKSDPDVAALGIEDVIHEYVAAVEAVRKTMEEVSAWTLHIDYNAKRQELLKRIKEFDEKHNIAAEFDQCLKEVIALEKKKKQQAKRHDRYEVSKIQEIMENLGVPSCLAVAIAKLEYDRGEGTTAAQPVIASQLSLDYFDEGDHKTSFKAPLWFIGGKTAFEKDLDTFYLGNMPNMLEKASAIKALLQAEEKKHTPFRT